jgi:hypothetical protein
VRRSKHAVNEGLPQRRLRLPAVGRKALRVVAHRAAFASARIMMSAPPDQLDKMDAATLFASFAELMKANPPHANDYPILDRVKRIGIEPCKSFSMTSQTAEIQEALKAPPVKRVE